MLKFSIEFVDQVVILFTIRRLFYGKTIPFRETHWEPVNLILLAAYAMASHESYMAVQSTGYDRTVRPKFGF